MSFGRVRRLTSTCFFHQIHNRHVIFPRCFLHADLAGDVGGIITVVIPFEDFGGFFFCGGCGQLGVGQAAVACEGAAAKRKWDDSRLGTLFCNGEHFCIKVEFARGAVGVQDDFFINGVDFEFGQSMVV